MVAPSETDDNPIWSGYTYTGGPFKAVSGTFTVPGAGTGASCTANVAEWVGIDGFGNNSLVQAGIGELASYTPPVVFSNLHETRRASQLVKMVIAQHGQKISVPSQFSAGGFTATYWPAGTYSGQFQRAGARRLPLPSLFLPAH